MHAHSYSVAQPCLSATPWTVTHRLLCPLDSLGKNTRVGCHFLLQGIFLTQRSNLRLLYPLHLCISRQILANLSYLRSAEAGKSRIKVPARQVSSGGLLPWLSRWLPSHCRFTQPLLCAHGAGSTCFLVSLLQKLL